ncbi:MAG: hypothetical protein GWN77_09455, partial [Gammaproteobacteria bacterium]|nr:hypothetical protein [Phycisphaerae bacterium]NIR27169.1 hypothetical protein [Gammaproteobacteria bacterium]NIX01499.1 hypothetical protein [Phycisphaerae bacterium]
QNLWLRGLGIAGLWFLFIMGAIIVIIATWNKVKPKYPAVEQTADEILEMSPVPGVTMEEFDQIRLMKAQGKSQTAIEWLISGNRGRNYTGGTVHRHVKAVLEYLEQTTSPPMDDEYLTGATQA